MADKKISALTAATTPLAGTEVLPIVQGGATVKVSVSNLTSGRFVNMDSATVGSTSSAAYGSKLRVDGGVENFSAQYNVIPGASTPYEFVNRSSNGGFDFYVDAAGKRSVRFLSNGDVSLTDNIIQATAGRGFNFTANANAPGMTSELLNWYEEGTFTPTVKGSSTAGVGTYSAQNGSYTRIGNRVMFSAYVAWSAHTGTGNLRVDGLPFAAANNANNYGAVAVYIDAATALSAGNTLQMRTVLGSTELFPTQAPTGGGAPSQVPLPASGGFMLTGHYYV